MTGTALTTWNAQQLALIKKTVAKDCDVDSEGRNLHLGEFDWFIAICRALNLDPLRRQIYAFVFNKDQPDRRQMVPVVAIGGYRSIAERTGNYRPGPSEIAYSEELKDPDTNPLGISHASATVYKYAHGEWHPITETAHWDEFAPIITEGDGGFEWVESGQLWQDGPKKGKPKMKKKPLGELRAKLDPKKDGWRKMGRVMIEKCAEARAIRRGWPDDTAGTYGEGELDRAEVLDLTATEMANNAEADTKLALIGGKNALTVDWCDGAKLVRVPEGQFCDTVLKWARGADRYATELRIWFQRNEAARAEYKARHGGEYLEFMKAFEARLKALDETEAKEAAE
jgi:phage recombination protein Bet